MEDLFADGPVSKALARRLSDFGVQPDTIEKDLEDGVFNSIVTGAAKRTNFRLAEDECKAKTFKLRDEKHPKYDGKTRTMQRVATGA